MSWRVRQDTNANRTTFTPALGEPFFATDTKRLWMGDGTTAGGVDPFATDPYGDTYNVLLYGAVGDGVTDDTAAIQAAIDAVEAAGGGRVLFPNAESYAATDLDVTGDYVTFDMTAGAEIISSATAGSCIQVVGANRFTVLGGRLTGPGKGTAASGCYGIELTGSPNCFVRGTEISGFYHGIRPDDSGTTYDCSYTELSIHDLAHTGIFPKDGDVVALCRFKDIGTTNQHHGLYLNTAIDRGVRCVGNHYDNVTGAGIHVNISTAAAVNGLTSVGETVDGCGWGMVLSTADAGATITNVHVTGMVINDTVVTAGDTGHGIQFVTSAGSISNIRIQAVINDSAGHGFNCDASAVSDCDFDVVVNGSVDYGVVLTADNCTGRFVSHDGTSIGVYMNGVVDSHLSLTTTANGNVGVYLTGACLDNVLDVYSSDNTGNGLYFGASTARNRATGLCQGNSSAQVNDGGTSNNTLNVTGAAVTLTVNAGTPEAAVTAGIGSICTDIANGVLYVKESGTGNTGWVVAGAQT